jgi:hypothetical protein
VEGGGPITCQSRVTDTTVVGGSGDESNLSPWTSTSRILENYLSAVVWSGHRVRNAQPSCPTFNRVSNQINQVCLPCVNTHASFTLGCTNL